MSKPDYKAAIAEALAEEHEAMVEAARAELAHDPTLVDEASAVMASVERRQWPNGLTTAQVVDTLLREVLQNIERAPERMPEYSTEDERKRVVAERAATAIEWVLGDLEADGFTHEQLVQLAIFELTKAN